MKLINAELEGFVNFLHMLELSPKPSRMRTRLIKLLLEKLQLFQTEWNQLLIQYSKKDGDGEPIKVIDRDENGNKIAKYDIADQEAFNQEFALLASEEVIIDVTESNKEMFAFVVSSVLNCEQTFSGQKAQLYDRYCEVCEEVEKNIGKMN